MDGVVSLVAEWVNQSIMESRFHTKNPKPQIHPQDSI